MASLDLWTSPTLELQGENIDEESSVQIAEALASTSAVRYLGLSSNQMGDAGVKWLCAGLRANKSVEILDLSNNNLSDLSAQYIADMLVYNNTLGSILLNNNKIRTKGAELLATALTQNQKLQKLNLAYNRIRGAGAIALADALCKNRGLKQLVVAKNEVNTLAGKRFAEVLKTNSTLQSLNLSYNLIGEALIDFGSSLTTNTTLLELDMEGSYISGEHVAAFSQSFLRCSLMSLNISNNSIGDAGMQPLLESLKQQASLRMLDISNIGITSRSMDDLCSVLKFCPMLETLQLDDNKIGCEGISVLSSTIKSSQSLTSLNVDRVGMDQVSAIAFSLALHHNQWFTCISLSGNDISDESCRSMCFGLKRMSLLNSVNLSKNMITESLLEELSSVFVNNTGLNNIQLQGNPIASTLIDGVLTRRAAQRTLESMSDKSSVVVPPLPVQPRARDMHLPKMGMRGGISFVGAVSADLSVGPLGTPKQLPNIKATPATLMEMAIHNRSAKSDSRSLMLPEARAATLLASADALAAEEAERENGTYPALIPSQNSLEHPLYPGFGRGKFSNGCSISTMDNVVPYTIYNSLQDLPVQKWNATISTADTIFHTRLRKVHKANPYSERALECNIGGLIVTERKLRQAFQELDVNGNGYLDKEEFRSLYRTFENFGVDCSEDEVESAIARYKVDADDDGKLSYDEFCVLMTKLAQR